MSIFVRARFEVRDGRQAEFEKFARALRERADEEPGTLTYRFFSTGDGGYLVLEEYADTAAALAHNEHTAGLVAQVRDFSKLVSLEFYGPVGQELRELAPNATVFPDVTAVTG